MKKKWQEKQNCFLAIKVVFNDNDVQFKLYDRFDRVLFVAKRSYPCTDDVFNDGVDACYDYANKNLGNDDNFIYVHNPYWMQCKDIMVG